MSADSLLHCNVATGFVNQLAVRAELMLLCDETLHLAIVESLGHGKVDYINGLTKLGF